ncbi:MAG: GDSL-type esterase/lipase family protein [Minicystis sp.]
MNPRALLRRPLLLVTLAFVIVAALLSLRASPGNWVWAVAASALDWLIALAVLFVIKRWRTRRRFILAVLGVVLLDVSIAELWCRRDIPVPDTVGFKFIHSPRYHHMHPANRRMFLGKYENSSLAAAASEAPEPDRAVYATTNEDGLRTRYSRAQFLGFRRRIAVLGDSFTFGLGVDQDAAFPQAIEAMLRGREGGDDLAVLNAGVTSHSPFVERRLLEQTVLSYRPQLVIMVLDATDIGDDYWYSTIAEDDGGLGHFGPSSPWLGEDREITDHSALFERIGLPARGLRALLLHPLEVGTRAPLSRLHLRFDGREENGRFFIYRYPLSRTEKYFQATWDNITAAAEAAARNGARFLLVVAPRFQHWNPAECPDNWERHEYALHEPFQDEYLRFFADAARPRTFPVLGLIDAFRAAKSFPLVFRNDPHWNARGHRVVARAIVDALDQRALLPGAN